MRDIIMCPSHGYPGHIKWNSLICLCVREKEGGAMRVAHCFFYLQWCRPAVLRGRFSMGQLVPPPIKNHSGWVAGWETKSERHLSQAHRVHTAEEIS